MASESVPTPHPSTARATILVADDDPDLLALMSRRLAKGGYLVVTASDGQQALDLATDVLPDLALLDIMMPRLTGLEVAARLRAHPATTAMKIILISAGFPKGLGDATAETEADAYILKPFDHTELVKRVGTLLTD